MLKPHLTRDSAEQYILGALAPEKAADLEAHTLECEPCAQLLQEEALLSEQLTEAAAAFPREDRVIRPARWHVRRAAVGAALAAAASLALIVLPGGRGTVVPASPAALSVTAPTVELEGGMPRTIGCPADLDTQEACAAQAQARGLLVHYPGGIMGEVPRYEARTGLPEGALTARRPVSL